jgi:uncharacterized protein (DUF342 family)
MSSKPTANAAIRARFTIQVSPDRLTASIVLPSQGGGRTPTRDEIVAKLKEAGCIVDEIVDKRIDAYLELWASEQTPPANFVLAKGTAVVEGKSEDFVWDPIFNRSTPVDEDAAVDYYTFHSIVTVEKDAVIGSITPMEAARSGTDVCGESIPPARQPVAIELAETVRRDQDDPSRIIAKVAGRVVYDHRRLSIQEVLDIRGDVNFDTGNVDSSIDVNIKGTVRDRFKVKSAKCISVGGAVEAAHIEAGADVAVMGGIVGRNEGKVTASGVIGAKFCDEAYLRAGGDIQVTKQLMNCRAHSEGRILSPRGAVIGGCVYARHGMEVATLGSDANVHTRLCVGPHPTIFLEADALEEAMREQMKSVEKIRGTVQPLMKMVKRLTPAQKEQACELLFKADEAEQHIKAAGERREKLLSADEPTRKARIVVNRIAYPGVTISVGRRVTTIQKELKGPIVIEARKVDKVTELVAINQLTGSLQILPSANLPLSELVRGFERVDAPKTPQTQSDLPPDNG